jgi:hypothetical protein
VEWLKTKKFARRTSVAGTETSSPRKERKELVTTNDANAANSRDLNSIQKQHKEGTLDVYKPVVAYVEEWVHLAYKEGNFIAAYPKEGTRRRQDLPSIAEQWRRDAEARSQRK